MRGRAGTRSATPSGRDRIVPLSERMIEQLDSVHIEPDGFLFCHDDGKRLGET